MNENFNKIKENTNVIDDDPESISRSEQLGKKVLGIIDSAEIMDTDTEDMDSEDWGNFLVNSKEEVVSGDQRGVVTLVPRDMIEDIESVKAA